MARASALPFPTPSVSPAVRAIQEWCGAAHERGWALRGLSAYHRADAARLLERSATLLARSRRARIKLLP